MKQVASYTPADSRSFVAFEKVSKSYDTTTQVVRDLDLDIAEGEFMTFLGPSGSGKTTTLMMLAGFEAPSTGTIRIGGKVVDQVPPYQRNMGFVFQSYALFPHMTVEENIGFPLRMRRIPKAEITQRVRTALDIVKMGSFGSRRPAQLSGGQQQRVALARALVFDPSLVLMDEPLGALDKQLREHMQYEIRDLHARTGLTFVYVTHDQSEALTMSDRIAIFNEGRLLQVADPRTLYEKPAVPFVASFVGENNILDCEIISIAGGVVRAALDDGQMVTGSLNGADLSTNRAIISIRPEHLLVNPECDVENIISGVVTEKIYLGDHLRINVTTADKILICKVATRHGAAMNAGDAVSLGWAISDAVILPVGAA